MTVNAYIGSRVPWAENRDGEFECPLSVRGRRNRGVLS